MICYRNNKTIDLYFNEIAASTPNTSKYTSKERHDGIISRIRGVKKQTNLYNAGALYFTNYNREDYLAVKFLNRKKRQNDII